MKMFFIRLLVTFLCLLCSFTGAEAFTTTTNYSFQLPQVNNVIDQNLWGSELNTNFSTLDSLLLTATNTIATSITTTATLTNANRNQLIKANATSAAFTINLQASATAGSGFRLTIKKTDSSANAVTILANSAELIDLTSSYVLTSQNQTVTLINDGTQWWVVVPVPPVAQTATTSSLGVVQPDGTTVTISTGIISAKQTPILGTATDFNSAATYNVTSLPAALKQININLDGVTFNGSSDIIFRIGDPSDGLKTSGYVDTFSNVTVFSGGEAATTYTSAIAGARATSASTVIYGNVTLNLIDSVNNIWVATGTIFDATAYWNVGGFVTLAAPLDRLTVTTVGGTALWTAGKINISYF